MRTNLPPVSPPTLASVESDEPSSLGTDVSAISDARVTAEGTIFHFHERRHNVLAKGGWSRAKKGRGMEDVRNLAQKSITRCERRERERFIRRDNNEMNVGAAASELSIKGFRRILAGSRDNKSRRSSFAIGRTKRAGSRRGNWVECRSSNRDGSFTFLHPAKWLRHTPRVLFGTCQWNIGFSSNKWIESVPRTSKTAGRMRWFSYVKSCSL